MGTPTLPPPVPGAACGHCDGVLWPTGKTPKFVKVSFRETVKCPGAPVEAPNNDFWYEQDEGNPCQWTYEDSLFFGLLDVIPGHSTLWLTNKKVGWNWLYFFNAMGPCETNFANEALVCDPNVGSIGGTATVDWPGP